MVAAAEKRRIDAEKEKRIYAEMLRQEQMRKAAMEYKKQVLVVKIRKRPEASQRDLTSINASLPPRLSSRHWFAGDV